MSNKKCEWSSRIVKHNIKKKICSKMFYYMKRKRSRETGTDRVRRRVNIQV